MMRHRVVFSPEAQDQLVDLYRYIASAASPAVAARHTDAIVGYCESLSLFPANHPLPQAHCDRLRC